VLIEKRPGRQRLRETIFFRRARIVSADEVYRQPADREVKGRSRGNRGSWANPVLLFSFAASRLTAACLNAGITAVAYETLKDLQGRLPLLTPMSEIAGRMSIQEGAKCLERPMMGQGILLGGVPGVAPANVLVLGAGVVGTNAARMAAGLAASVALMDVNLDRLRTSMR
jgi:alanine dehydrogenase